MEAKAAATAKQSGTPRALELTVTAKNSEEGEDNGMMATCCSCIEAFCFYPRAGFVFFFR
jgi:hypothetical protein